MTDPVLQITNLSGGYGRFDVVHDITMHVNNGEAVALLGPNGAGKTSVLRSIMGLIKHRTGSIVVGSTDVSHLPAYKVAKGHAALVP